MFPAYAILLYVLIVSVYIYLFSSKRRNYRVPTMLSVDVWLGCLGGAVVGRWTRDRQVAGSTPGRGAIKSTRSTQPSILPG